MSNPYKETFISREQVIRVFDDKTPEEEFVWHRDREDRLIIPMDINDWKFQIDNSLPEDLDKPIFVKKETYHRLIKGSGVLRLRIYKRIEN